MLKTQVIDNTWKCDGCGLETNTEVNPYYCVSVEKPKFKLSTICIIDLCDNCIAMIATQGVIDFINEE